MGIKGTFSGWKDVMSTPEIDSKGIADVSLKSSKLGELDLCSSLCNWILDFLNSRLQLVWIGHNTSSLMTVRTGAVQRCVLIPLYYSPDIHHYVARHSSDPIFKYVDNTTVVEWIPGNEELKYRRESGNHIKWCQTHKLAVNVSNTKNLIVDCNKESNHST